MWIGIDTTAWYNFEYDTKYKKNNFDFIKVRPQCVLDLWQLSPACIRVKNKLLPIGRVVAQKFTNFKQASKKKLEMIQNGDFQ